MNHLPPLIAGIVGLSFWIGYATGHRKTLLTAEQKGVAQRLDMDGQQVWIWRGDKHQEGDRVWELSNDGEMSHYRTGDTHP